MLGPLLETSLSECSYAVNRKRGSCSPGGTSPGRMAFASGRTTNHASSRYPGRPKGPARLGYQR